MSIYDEVKVELSLGDLATIHGAANSWSVADNERLKLAKKNEDLVAECEKQAKEINLLRCRVSAAEDELAAWKQAANADKPEVDALAYLDEHNTPFESNDVDKACEVIRALQKKKVDAPVGSDNAEGLS